MAAPLPSANLAELLAHGVRSRKRAGRPVFLTAGGEITFGQVHKGAARAAGILRTCGVRPGDRVIIALSDSIEFVWAFLGTVRLGAVAVTANPWLPARDHAHMLDDAAASVAVCEVDLSGRFPGRPVLTPGDLWDEPAEIPPVHPVLPDTAAYVQYTSGTTGPPKGVVHRHSDAGVYYRAMAQGALGISETDTVLSVSKAYYAYGLGNTVLFPLLSGATAVLRSGQLTVPDVARLMRRHKPTIFCTVPGFYARLVTDGGSGFPAASLRVAVSAGEPLLPALASGVEELLGCPLLDELGTTEVGHGFVCGTGSDRRHGAIGAVLPPYEIEVRGRGGKPVPPGERGSLYVRGPTVLREYLNRPAETARVLDSDGWLGTGDLVRIDADGLVYHYGRVGDQEPVTAGMVSPLEAERVLAAHEAVSEVAVVGDGSDGLHAFVVPAPPWLPGPAAGADVSEVVELEGDELNAVAAELLSVGRDRLPPSLAPHAVTFLRAMPRGATGKVRRSLLRKSL